MTTHWSPNYYSNIKLSRVVKGLKLWDSLHDMMVCMCRNADYDGATLQVFMPNSYPIFKLCQYMRPPACDTDTVWRPTQEISQSGGTKHLGNNGIKQHSTKDADKNKIIIKAFSFWSIFLGVRRIWIAFWDGGERSKPLLKPGCMQLCQIFNNLWLNPI